MRVISMGVEISPSSALALENDLLDIDEWIIEAVAGKVANCRSRMLREWVPILLADPNIEDLPANEDSLIEFIVSHPTYKNRSARELDNA